MTFKNKLKILKKNRYKKINNQKNKKNKNKMNLQKSKRGEFLNYMI